MRNIVLRPRFDLGQHIPNAFQAPRDVANWGAANLKPTIDDQDRNLLLGLEQSSIPKLVISSAFDAIDLSVPTPELMAFCEPSIERVLASVLAIAGAANLLPISFAYENGGLIAVNISPQRQLGHDGLGYRKSRKALRGHTDGSFLPTPTEFRAGENNWSCAPDFVILACIRNPDSVPTRISALSDVVSKLNSAQIIELSRPIFILTPQASFDFRDDPIRYGPVLWRDDEGNLCCRISHGYVAVDDVLHSEASQALQAFHEAVSDTAQGLILEPGQILIINNRTAIHGRDEVGNWHEAARWLVRCYANRQITPYNQLSTHRPWVAT